jgi:ADP-ribose pyrophosphatase
MTAETVWSGKYIKVIKDGTWEYVGRAIDDGHVLLVEQFRVPLGRACLELPAGLVGDEDAGESVIDSAARELEEETGYQADSIESLGFFHSSPGMVSEGFTLVRARGLRKVNDGGGIEGEGITVHRVPVTEIAAFVADKRAEGLAMDVKLLLLLGAGMFSD